MRNCLYMCSIPEAQEILFAQMTDGLEKKRKPRSGFMFGTMGIGKSATVQALAALLNAKLGLRTKVIDLRLSGMDAGDVQGIPHVLSGKMCFSTPEWWPADDYDYYILFLDEMTNATKETMKAAYRLVLDRSIQNGKVLPDNCMIIGAGNMPDDGTGARDMLPALANRFGVQLIIDVDKVRKDFPDFALNSGFHIDVVSYLNYKPDNVVGKPKESAFNTPRSWEAVSDHLFNNYLSESLREKSICGAIGSEVGSDFLAYRELNEFIPDFDKIISGKIGFDLPREVNKQFAIVTPLVYRVSKEIKAENMDNAKILINTCMQKYSDDMKIIMIRILKSDEQIATQILSYQPLRAIFDQVRNYVR